MSRRPFECTTCGTEHAHAVAAAWCCEVELDDDLDDWKNRADQRP